MTIILDGTKGTTTPGLYSSTTFTGTYADGIVVDYTSTLGRISVGTADGLAFYNGGVATTELMRLDSSGNLGIGSAAGATSGRSLDINGVTLQPLITMRATSATSATTDWTLDTTNSLVSFNSSNWAIRWNVNGAERARIDSSGNLLVGTTSNYGPARLIVQGDGSNRIIEAINKNGTDSSSFGLYIGKYANDSTTSQRFIGFSINNDNVGSGQINANGASQAAFGSFSDARLKENIIDIEPQLEKIMALRPVEFDYKDGSGHQTGFIAQEMQDVYPDAVAEQDGFLTITGYGKTEARLIKAIQEQQAIIEQLRADVAALKGQA